MKLRIYFVAAILWPITLSSISHADLVQWTTESGGNGHYYEVVPENMSWLGAVDAAGLKTHMGANGYLATITSAGENSLIASLVADAEVDSALIGGYQDHSAPDYLEPSGGWRWITGETWSYTNWIPGIGGTSKEPNNGGSGEEALHIYSANYTYSPGFAGAWNDIPQEYVLEGNHGYVIEYDVIPVPLPPAFLLGMIGFSFASIKLRNKFTGIP